MHDYHDFVSFTRRAEARLPVHIAHVDGHFIIASIDKNRVDPSSFPFAIDDQVVAFNGRPVAEVAAELEKTATTSNAQRRHRRRR